MLVFLTPKLLIFVVKKQHVDSLTEEDTVGSNKRVRKETDQSESTTGSSEKLPEVGIHSRPEESQVESGLSGFSDLFLFPQESRFYSLLLFLQQGERTMRMQQRRVNLKM